MKCWICGDDATSREHRTKKSDLSSVFGAPTKDRPLYFHDAQRSNQKIQGLNSKLLKFPDRICSNCNNARTQPHDRAWEKLSEELRKRQPSAGDVIRANRVFRYNTRREMLNVHLYFLKLFGCMIKEGSVPIDVGLFSESIIQEKAHPCVYLEIATGRPFDGKGMVGQTDLEALKNDDNVCVFAAWQYQLDSVAINIIFASSEEDWDRERLARTWHPKFGTNKLVVAE